MKASTKFELISIFGSVLVITAIAALLWAATHLGL
jgi:hypothetical protein